MKKSDKEEIVKNYKEKVKLFKSFNKSYYTDDSPLLSDAKYDDLKKELISLEKKNKFLSKLGSVSKIIGAPLSNKFEKLKHIKPMLSLSNAFNKNDMEDFLSKIANFLNKKNLDLELSSEPKIDGISASLTYE